MEVMQDFSFVDTFVFGILWGFGLTSIVAIIPLVVHYIKNIFERSVDK